MNPNFFLLQYMNPNLNHVFH